MDHGALTAQLEQGWGDRYRQVRGRLTGGPQIAVVDWADLSDMLEAHAADHADTVHVRLYCASRNSSPDNVLEVALREDESTIWRWIDAGAVRSTASTPRRDDDSGQRPPGRPRRALAEVVETATELRLVNGSAWPADRPRYGKTWLMRRCDWTADRARDRIRDARHQWDASEEFRQRVDDEVARRRTALAYGIAALTHDGGLTLDEAAGRLRLGVPVDQVEGLAGAVSDAAAEIKATAAELREALPGGPAKAAGAAYAAWRAEHPHIDPADVVAAAQSYAEQIAGGTARKLTVRSWLGHLHLDGGADES